MPNVKIHPHIKNFIHSVVLSELHGTGTGKDYLWKEEVFKNIERHILENISSINTKEDMEKEIDKRTKLLKEELNKVLEMASGTLKNIPIDIIKKISKTNGRI